MSIDRLNDRPNDPPNNPPTEQPCDPAMQDCIVIDLRVTAYEALVEAAGQSNWIPQEHYTANDWIADCCTFLREGPGGFLADGASPPRSMVEGLLEYATNYAQLNGEPGGGDCWGTIRQATLYLERAPADGASAGVPPAAQGLSNEQLLAELSRRGLLSELHGAVGALHDHLERAGHLDSEAPTTSYLLYRLRRQGALLSGTSDAQQVAAFWDQKIAELDEHVEDVATHVTEMSRQYGFTVDDDSVREAVAEAADLLGITLDESAARRACVRAMEQTGARLRQTQGG